MEFVWRASHRRAWSVLRRAVHLYRPLVTIHLAPHFSAIDRSTATAIHAVHHHAVHTAPPRARTAHPSVRKGAAPATAPAPAHVAAIAAAPSVVLRHTTALRSFTGSNPGHRQPLTGRRWQARDPLPSALTRMVARERRQDARAARPPIVVVRGSSPRVPAATELASPAPELARPAAAPDRSAVAPAAPPGVNVEHLTEQVMRQIDRRLTAWRERTGRF
jgi:hypothetical protein